MDVKHMNGKTFQDNQNLIEFWDKAYMLSEEDREKLRRNNAADWKDLAPSEKLCRAAVSLGEREKVLDYGCGDAWGGIIAARSGCPDVTAADVAAGAIERARFYAEVFGAGENLHVFSITPDWLQSVPAETYDGILCSNVLDVVPPETAEEILLELARIATGGASVVLSLNYYLPPETAARKGMQLTDGNRVYIDGVLRLVSRSDEEWRQIFAPFFTVEKLEHFAWPGEAAATRRLFYLKKREDL